MRVGTPGFKPSRLTEAREARRVASKSALAKLVDVSPTSVSRWEDEEAGQSPDYATLVKIAEALNVRPEFFLRPSYSSTRPTFFRSLTSTLVRDRSYQRAQMRWLQEVSFVLSHYVDFPKVDIPDVLEKRSYRELRDDDFERIASDLRSHWSLGHGPCVDMVTLMEKIGIVVSAIPVGSTKLDGLCSWSPVDDRPHVLLATDKMSFPRRQMDAAHELAHAVLHRHVDKEEFQTNLRMIESQAFRLASAFLMPSTTYPYEVLHPSLSMLARLKERWRVSIKAQIKRLADLELVPEDHVRQLFKLYSAKGWSKGEPLDQFWPLRQPKMLRDSLNLIVDGGVRSKSDLLATEFTISGADIELLCSLSAGWFERDAAQVVELKLRAQVPNHGQKLSGEIVPFRKA